MPKRISKEECRQIGRIARNCARNISASFRGHSVGACSLMARLGSGQVVSIRVAIVSKKALRGQPLDDVQPLINRQT